MHSLDKSVEKDRDGPKGEQGKALARIDPDSLYRATGKKSRTYLRLAALQCANCILRSFAMDSHSENHDPHEHNSGTSHRIPSSATAMATRTLLSFLRAAGYEDLADYIAKLPEHVGEALGAPLKRVKNKAKNGDAINPADEKELTEAMTQHPQETVTALGLLLTHVGSNVVDADSERKKSLQSYALVLNTICDFMAKAQTSVALRGFLHDANCVSYWHIRGRGNPTFSQLSDSLVPFDLEVYFIRAEPSAELLASLNETIRRSSNRHLPSDLYDYEYNHDIAKLNKIYETNITTSELHPSPNELKTPKPDPFGLAPDPNKPMEFVTQIPSKVPSLIPMFESLFEAKKAQGPPIDPEEIKARVRDTLKKVS
jgi:hypothetical protein